MLGERDVLSSELLPLARAWADTHHLITHTNNPAAGEHSLTKAGPTCSFADAFCQGVQDTTVSISTSILQQQEQLQHPSAITLYVSSIRTCCCCCCCPRPRQHSPSSSRSYRAVGRAAEGLMAGPGLAPGGGSSTSLSRLHSSCLYPLVR